jgi:hypothetical protein
MDIPPWMLAPLRDQHEDAWDNDDRGDDDDDDGVRALEETGQSHGHGDQSIRLIARCVRHHRL